MDSSSSRTEISIYFATKNQQNIYTMKISDSITIIIALNFITCSLMKKILPIVVSLSLSACGGNTPENSAAPERLAAISTEHVETKVLMGVPGERKVYDITWNNGLLTGTSKLPALTNFQLATSEIRLQDISLSFDKDGATGQLYRLYKAAFGRVPDVQGLGYWKNAIDNDGLTINQVATEFLASVESKTIFGSDSDNATFVDRLYLNVLNRKADAAGAAYWMNVLKSGNSRVDVLLSFTDSTENKAATDATINKGMAFAEPGVSYTPVANVTGPADVAIGIDVAVDGSASSDANDDVLRYNWSITASPAGSTASLTNTAIAKPHIIFDKAGTYELTLSVGDGTSLSYTPAKLKINAHALVTDTGTYMCSTISAAQAISLYANGHTYLDRNKNGIPCDAPDVAFESAPTVPAIADTGRYKCSEISHETAILLFLQGNTYLDRDHDGKPCEANDITVEKALYPSTPVSSPTAGMCWVNGYTKKNGTHVSGYWRRC